MPPKKSKKTETPPSSNQGKKGTGPRKNIVKSGNAGSNKNPNEQPSDQKKSIFGDWTGKTPVSLLHEHCQKQGWEKPTFDMGRRKQGFVGTVQLGKRNKKTAQIQTITLTPPATTQTDLCLPTALEARHLAATFALHRINSHMPMYRVLPPQHRDYWQRFEQLKTKDNAWQYVPDPFGAQPPTPAKRVDDSRRITKDSVNAAVPMSQQSSRMAADQLEEEEDDDKRKRPTNNSALDEKLRKYWESLPAIHMSSENRELVEDVVKKSNIVYQPVGTTLSDEERKEITEGLVRMGFRSSHVDEALEYCSDTAMALDWLCLHVPEDDLPPTFMHANYKPTLSTISHTTQSLGHDWLIKRMTTFGYPKNVCEEAMEQCQNDDIKALELLQWRLVHGQDEVPEPLAQLEDEENELETIWQEEAIALESIYGPHFEQNTEEENKGRYQFNIQLFANIEHRGKQRKIPITLQVTIAKQHSHYPNTLPIFTIICDKLPAYLKLSMIKGVISEAEKNLGLPMVYMCAEWLQEHVDDLIANPPKLRDVTEGITSMVTHPKQPALKKRRKNNVNGGKKLSPGEREKISQQLKEDLHTMRSSDAYAPMGRVRENLPADKFQDKVIQTVLEHQVSIVCGETGCGKTTQVPQFILDTEIENNRGSACNIICTQPRKVAAIGVAERVAAERCEKIGASVGYAVRGETKISSQTRLQFVTTGVLLRRLHSDPSLEGISHVMIDEVHERSVDSDFLLIILRQVLKKRKDLKVVLMSATINQQVFADYFGGAPAIEIPGFTHPVKDYYLEDIIQKTSYVSKMPMPKQVDKEEKGNNGSGNQQWAGWQLELLEQGYDTSTVQTMARYRNQDKMDYDLIAHVVKHIVENGTVRIDQNAQPAILVFMPGAMEIRRCIEAMQSTLTKGDSDTKYEILPLHANLSPQEQTSVFKKVAADVCKIVVATNVAETSITIDGVVYVIDAGRVKETQYDANNSMMRLVETWASRASCKQRRGRAGRTRPGECYKMFSRDTEARKMHAQQVPELLRTPLEQLCLQVKSMGEFDVKQFLRMAIDPPKVAALDSAIRTLQAVDAIDSSPRGELTPLGRHMASIPADLRIGKMLLLGSIFSCLDPILTIASIMSLKSPFTSPMEKREEAKQCRERFSNAGNIKSDWITDMNAFEKWHQKKKNGMREARRFCEENFLSFATLTEIASLKRQYADALTDIGFYDRHQIEKYNQHNDNMNLIRSIVFGGLNPNVAKIRMPDAKYDKVLSGTVEREKEAKEIKFYTKQDGRVFLHPSSILFNNNHYNGAFLTYFSRMETSKIFLRDGTEVPHYAILFFGGRVDIDHFGRGLKVGEEGWIKFRAWARIGVLVNQLKRLLLDELDCKIQDPTLDVSASRVVQTMISLITNNGV